MPERRGLGRWHALGRLLPADVRTRVFEPALSDLVYRRLKAPGRPDRLPFAVHAIGTLLACLPAAGVRIFYERGRLTRLGRASVWGVALLVTLGLVMTRLRQAYDA